MTEELPKVFSEELLQEVNKSKTPCKLVTPVVHEWFKFLGGVVTEEDSKVTWNLSIFFVDSYAHFKHRFLFTTAQCCVLLDIILHLVIFTVKTSEFCKESDLKYLQSLALPYSQGMNPMFPPSEMTKALDHLTLTYFNHYSLYKFLFTHERSQENIVTLLDIDIPLPLPSHSNAVQRITRKDIKTPEQQLDVKETEVLHVKESLKERLLKNMEESTREKFIEKIAEARETMAKQLEQRDKMLKQKWEDLEKELKRKRRRG